MRLWFSRMFGSFGFRHSHKNFVKEGFERHRESSLFKTKGPESVTPKDVFDHAKLGDQFALQIFNTVVDALAAAIGSLVNIFNPQMVVLGGGMANAAIFCSNLLRKGPRVTYYQRCWGLTGSS